MKANAQQDTTFGEEFDLTLYSKEENKSLRAPNICSFFYDAIFPYLVALQFGGTFPLEENKDTFTSGCTDRQKVEIEIKRVKNENLTLSRLFYTT